uniref:Ras-related protein Rab-21 n=1 Tax=Panagrellus redivivus TaxID=6233 RepID=A0A7E4UN01_PANRE
MSEDSLDKAKVVVAGDGYVGKTALLTRYLFGRFISDYHFTVGIDFHSKAVTLPGNKAIRLQLWDTAGQERFRALLPSYLRDCCVVLVAYDLTNKQSFNGLAFWIEYVRRHSNNQAAIIIVGTKSDLTNDRQVSRAEAEKLGETFGVVVTEASALSGDGINELFQLAGQLAAQVRLAKAKPDLDDARKTAIKLSLEHHKMVKNKHFIKRCCM